MAEDTASQARRAFTLPSAELPAATAESGVLSREEIPDIADENAYGALRPGTKYRDPSGAIKTKKWRVTDEASYALVPEGAQYISPDGETKTKAKYGPLAFTAQTLYDMAGNENEQRGALAKVYGDAAVKKTNSGELYVEGPDGMRLKPGHGSFGPRAAAAVIGEAAPTLGAVGGGILGTLGGGIPGGIAGSGAGGALGQGINDAMLALLGVYNRSPWEEALSLGKAGGGAMAGQAGGELIGRAIIPAGRALFNATSRALPEIPIPSVLRRAPKSQWGERTLDDLKEMVEGAKRDPDPAYPHDDPSNLISPHRAERLKASGILSAAMAEFLGANKATPEVIDSVRRLAEQGVRVRPSAIFLESPYLKKVVEEFDPQFRGQKILQQSAQEHYEARGRALLESLGVRLPREPLTGAKARPSSQEPGEAMQTGVRSDIASEDAALEARTNEAREAAKAKAAGDTKPFNQAIEALQNTHDEALASAQAEVDRGFASVREDMDALVKEAGTGGNPGDLARRMTETLTATRARLSNRASRLYRSLYRATEGEVPNLGDVPDEARALLQGLPKSFRDKYPDIVRRVERLAGEETEEEGAAKVTAESPAGTAPEPKAEPEPPPSFEQLHKLRTLLRSGIDWHDITPDMREGVFRSIQSKINGILHDKGAGPALNQAAEMLDRIDAWYGRNLAFFKHDGVEGTMRLMEAGIPPDPKALAKTLFTPDESEFIARARAVVGKPLWGAVQAADTQAIFDASKTVVEGETDAIRFASQVEARIRNGILAKAYSPELAGKLQQQAQRILMMEGKLPVSAQAGDTVASYMQRAADAAEQITKLAEADPIGTLNAEMKRIEQGFAARRKELDLARANDPLHFLADPTVGAMKAADKILSDPDLFLAAAGRFGAKSDSFQMLRQVGALRLFQRSLMSTRQISGHLSAKVPEEVQRLLFPGVTRDEAIQLARDMELLLGTRGDVGGSMAAAGRVLHPQGEIVGSKLLRAIPFSGTVGRVMLGKFYAVITNTTTRPGFVQWVLKGARSENPAFRAEVRAQVSKMLGPIGAGAEEMREQQKMRAAP